jgi:hypothetical protein
LSTRGKKKVKKSLKTPFIYAKARNQVFLWAHLKEKEADPHSILSDLDMVKVALALFCPNLSVFSHLSLPSPFLISPLPSPFLLTPFYLSFPFSAIQEEKKG